MRAGEWLIDVDCTVKNNGIILNFPYNKLLLEEVKTRFERRRWLGDEGIKAWYIPITYRNLFQFEYLMGKHGVDPYMRFDTTKHVDRSEEIKAVMETYRDRDPNFEILPHLIQMVNLAINTRWSIFAARMGLGKTFASIIVNDFFRETNWWWFGPNRALDAVQVDFMKWRPKLRPEFCSYDSARKLIETWPSGKPAPRFVVLDEVSKLKNAATQRATAMKYLCDSMRKEHGESCVIIALSGTPAPHSPEDWFSICEIVCPGFLKEANIHLFRDRLGLFEERETVRGSGTYKHLITWKDSEKKCGKCGKLEEVHHLCLGDTCNQCTKMRGDHVQDHGFVQGQNEVTKLYKRMKGLVGVWLKEGNLNLPAKRYVVHEVTPTQTTLNLAKSIVASTKRTLDALIKLRCLSDGFQYNEKHTGYDTCPDCYGHKEVKEYFDAADLHTPLGADEYELGARFIYDENDNVVDQTPIKIVEQMVCCATCEGEGRVPTYDRETIEVSCPKDQVIRDELKLALPTGRLNLYGGFQGSVDRLVRLSHEEDWHSIRCDGRGWSFTDPAGNEIVMPGPEILYTYMYERGRYPRISFNGQPGAAGMGLNLVCSWSTIFYSNDHNAESREQAEDRGHRLGMNKEHGGRIVDIVHLPSDRKVISSLKQKRNLQYMSMTGLAESILTLK